MKNKNILIALFMGWKIDNSFPDKDRIYRSPGGAVELDTTFKFHKDWNLLLKVIKKLSGDSGDHNKLVESIDTFDILDIIKTYSKLIRV